MGPMRYWLAFKLLLIVGGVGWCVAIFRRREDDVRTLRESDEPADRSIVGGDDGVGVEEVAGRSAAVLVDEQQVIAVLLDGRGAVVRPAAGERPLLDEGDAGEAVAVVPLVVDGVAGGVFELGGAAAGRLPHGAQMS